jgi:hypothetical protein
MDIFSRDTLVELTAVPAARTLSIFLPTHRAGPDIRPFAAEDVIRWKNLVRDAADQLAAAEMPPREVDALLQPARELADDQTFWQYQADGLAAFAAPGLFQTFRVPLHLDELVVVAPRFHLKPLLPLLAGDSRFYVLALSQNQVRLIEANRDSASEVDLGNAPRSLQEALRFDDPERQLQFHTGSGAQPRGKRAAVFHGHGVGIDDQNDNILRFCRQVDRGLSQALRPSGAPLMLAAVESVAAIYRQANTYQHLLDAVVQGNPEGLGAREIHEKAWPLVEPVIHAERSAAVGRYQAARGSAKTTARLVVRRSVSHGRAARHTGSRRRRPAQRPRDSHPPHWWHGLRTRSGGDAGRRRGGRAAAVLKPVQR